MKPGARDSWEARYARSEGTVWSGLPHPLLAELTADLDPGISVDIGCGEGADTLWLAERGWHAHGVDFSATAIGRARRAAKEQDAANAWFHICDLESFSPKDPVDLVTAFFFHPRGAGARQAFLETAASWIGPGGHLLLVAHGDRRQGSTRGPTPVHPGEDRRILEGIGNWRFLRVEKRLRDGTSSLRRDSVVFAQKE